VTRKTVRVSIEGLVQGVWYRAWASEQAMKRNLDGWVRNRHDGSVEAVFSGPPEMVDEIIEACWQGPKLARVEAIHVLDEPNPEESGFNQKSTA